MRLHSPLSFAAITAFLIGCSNLPTSPLSPERAALSKPSFAAGNGPVGGELMIQSGFDGSEIVTGANNKADDLVGADLSLAKPNDWVLDFENRADIGKVQIYYESGLPSQRIAKIWVDPLNQNNKILKFLLFDTNVMDPEYSSGKGRVQMDVYGNSDLYEVYQSVRVLLPTSTYSLVKNYASAIDWLTLMEFWNDGPWEAGCENTVFRISVNLEKPSATPGSSLYLSVHGQTNNPGDGKFVKGKYVWDERSTVAMPIGQWFTLETYFKEGGTGEGRFYMAMTSSQNVKTVLFDIRNTTLHPKKTNPDGLKAFNPLKLYTGSGILAWMKQNGKALDIFYDDFRLWKNARP
ncbi:MAG: hypothetical protein JNM63_00360 [Spirochaetia bacterium]|nr:hypothetical protein [Spirochaetia bacterium]